jgi:hypothetical protein
VLKKHLHLHPYRISSVHELKERDSVKGVEYCRRFGDVITANRDDILEVAFFFTDEAWFHLSGYVNSQNSRVWSATKPHEIQDTPLYDEEIGVWWATSRNRIIGPMFFDDTINSKRCCEVIL